MIAVLDYGMGNLRSVEKALKRIEVPVEITRDHDTIRSADKLILPGVGHFHKGMENLAKFGLIDLLNEQVLEQKKPVLGICLGMQLLGSFSEEGNVAGLGWIDAKATQFHFEKDSGCRVPHIGWNDVKYIHESPIYANIRETEQYYFVHSFYVTCTSEDNVATVTQYGHPFVSSMQKGRIYGTQFHPEKSHDAGLRLLKNFHENG